jgi:MscS family membrane protein
METLKPILQFVGDWAGSNTWIMQVFLVVLVTLLIDFVQRRVLKKVHSRLLGTSNRWDDALLAAATRPVTLLIWIVGITFAADIVSAQTQAPIFNAVGPLREVGVITVLAWFLLRLIANVEQNIIARGTAGGAAYDKTTVQAVSKLVRAAVMITAILVALQTLGFSVSGVLAFGGIGGIAIGFAAKDLLANFFGGLMIYLDRPFEVGDWVRSPDRDIEGHVENIGWRLTTIRSFQKRPIYLPNSMFASIAVENPSRMTHRRIHESIGIRYEDAGRMAAIVADVQAMLRGHPDIDDSQTLIVNFNSFAPSSLDFFIYTFTHTTNWVEYHRVKQDVLLKITDIIAEQGAEIAFPTSTVHIPDRVELVNANP